MFPLFFCEHQMFTYEKRGTVRNVSLRSLKCFTTNVTRAEKNVLKHQIDKTRGNMSGICSWLDVLKQDESWVSIQNGIFQTATKDASHHPVLDFYYLFSHCLESICFVKKDVGRERHKERCTDAKQNQVKSWKFFQMELWSTTIAVN